MTNFFTITLLTFFSFVAYSQTELLADFEDIILEQDSFLNGAGGETEHISSPVRLSVNYNESYMSWTGWAISNTTDTITPGFTNQYSAITGSGVDGSENYAVSFNFVPNPVEFEDLIAEVSIMHSGVYITNATYTYLSMLNGDAFAKKFGGVDGTDPDFFLLTIRGTNLDGDEDTVEFYLADYRSDNSDDDYIVNEWTFVDLSKFTYGEPLSFELTTTDIGNYGPATPAYFCIDNFTFDILSDVEDPSFDNLNIYPNPVHDIMSIEFEGTGDIAIFDQNGRLVQQSVFNPSVDVSRLPKGVYSYQITTEKGSATRKFVKI